MFALQQDISAGHKIALVEIGEGEDIFTVETSPPAWELYNETDAAYPHLQKIIDQHWD